MTAQIASQVVVGSALVGGTMTGLCVGAAVGYNVCVGVGDGVTIAGEAVGVSTAMCVVAKVLPQDFVLSNVAVIWQKSSTGGCPGYTVGSAYVAGCGSRANG